MALTRKFLKALGIEDEKIDQIIEAHTDTVDGLKQYKEDAEKLPEIQSQLDEAKKKLKKFEDDGFEKKYNDLQTEFNNYKDTEEKAKTAEKKKSAYREILKKAGVSEKRFDAILRITDLDKIELDDKGEIKDGKTVEDSVKKEWQEFIVKSGVKGAETATPPGGDGTEGRTPSRAAMVAKRYYANVYGEPKKEN